MHFTKFLALAAVFAGTAFAAPAADADATAPKPTKPAKPVPTFVSQSNACGYGVTPYCCNSDNAGQFNTCYSMTGGSQCSTTIVCCNAQNSIQLCVGNVNVVLK